MNDLVSVIITTHNRDAKILKRAIDSVLCQTYQNFEIIVVNDNKNYVGNTDIEKLMHDYNRSDITYVYNVISPGACGSRNIGIREAHGEFIALLDDDDSFCETKIEEMLLAFDEDIGMVYSDYEIIGSKHKTNFMGIDSDSNINCFERLLYGNYIGGCSIPIIRKKCFECVGGFDESFPSAQDYEMWLRITKEYKIKSLSKKLVKYYYSSNSITSSPNRRVKGIDLLLSKYEEAYSNDLNAKLHWCNQIIELLFQYGQFNEGYTRYRKLYTSLDWFKYLYVLIRGFVKYILFAVGGRKR